jgi:hypothetical protein
MSITAAFQWQSEPVSLLLSFGAGRPVRADASAILFPIVAQSRISRQLASTLEYHGLANREGRSLVAAFRVQGTERALRFRLMTLMPSFPDERGRAPILLGLDFIAAFGTAVLDLTAPTGVVTIG